MIESLRRRSTTVGFLPKSNSRESTSTKKQIKALQDAAAESEKVLAEKDAKIAESAKYRADLEKTRIALAAGLDPKYADRLRGENADEWKKDAEDLAKDFAAAHVTAPLGNPEGNHGAKPDTRTQFADWFKESFSQQ